jgi:pimeloyl-ACP methyl ester carboxylesterase
MRTGGDLDHGKGRLTLVAVHGNGGGGARFDAMRAHLPAGLRLVAPDLPGFGDRSGIDPERLTMADYAAALEQVLAALPRPRVLLGHGIGGSFVLEWLQRGSSAVDGVILHAPVGAHLDRRWFPRLMRSRLARWCVQRGISSRWLRPLVRRRLLRGRDWPRAAVDRFFADYRRCRAFGRMFDLIDAAWFDGLRPVEVPAVLLWGGRERVLDPSHAEAFRALLPGAGVVVEPGWDHFPMIDDPAGYTARVAGLARALVHPGLDPRTEAACPG